MHQEYLLHTTHKHLFDFPKNSNFFDEANKNVIGNMKNVSEGKIIDEFVGLKSEMYSIKNIMVKNLYGKRSKYRNRV